MASDQREFRDKALSQAKNRGSGAALLEAIRSGDDDFAVRLLQEGANLDAHDSYRSALTQAIRGGYEEHAAELLGRGAKQ